MPPFAVTRAIEIIGEAGARISMAAQSELPSVPWPLMAGMRNRLVHAYFDIDRDILWRPASVSIPAINDRSPQRPCIATFPAVLRAHDIQIGMDGKGCWRDNAFVERLWRSVKYEDRYLHTFDSVSDVRPGLTRQFTLFNERRPHRALESVTPT